MISDINLFFSVFSKTISDTILFFSVFSKMISDTILFFSVFSKTISDINKLSTITIQSKIEYVYLITTSY
jgi:hypothetical protein